MMAAWHHKFTNYLPGPARSLNLDLDFCTSRPKYFSWTVFLQFFPIKNCFDFSGILIERQSCFETTPMSIHDCGFTGTDPLDSYSKAIQLAEKQAAVLSRLAKVRHLQKPYGIFFFPTCRFKVFFRCTCHSSAQ